jgi:hypothetical protein
VTIVVVIVLFVLKPVEERFFKRRGHRRETDQLQDEIHT